MSTAVLLRLPSHAAQKLALAPAADNLYRLSWVELAFRLARATGNPGFAEVEKVRRGFVSLWYAQSATKMALSRSDWNELAWETGLLALFDDPSQIKRETAACFLECFFQVLFSQPQRFRECETRSVRPEHIMGWVYTLSIGELAELSYQDDLRLTPVDGFRPSILYSGMRLYLQRSGQIQDPEPAAVPEPEPLVVPLPHLAELK